MIILKNLTDCSGCTACATVCPAQCIDIYTDREGFKYPRTDPSQCINCNLCNKVCPIIKRKTGNGPSHSDAYSTSMFYAAKADSQALLEESSSGGIFTIIATHIINQEGGIVFGSAWHHGLVRHIAVDNIEDLSCLRGSKYVQSDLGDTLAVTAKILKTGRKVLFTGTPCQIAGIKSVATHNADNLITIEVACHGTPSPKVLNRYLEELKDNYNKPEIQLQFRKKPKGWLNYYIEAYSEREKLFSQYHKDNIFMKGFLRELYSRPACHDCSFKANSSKADFTLADFWGIQTLKLRMEYSKGVSLVIVNTPKAHEIWQQLSGIEAVPVTKDDALRYNGSLIRSERPHPERGYFFKHLNKKLPLSELIEKCLKLRFTTRLYLKISSIMDRVLHLR